VNRPRNRAIRADRECQLSARAAAVSQSRGAPQSDDRQVHVGVYARNLEIDAGAGPSRDEDARCGARGTTRPVRSGLDPWATVRWKAPEVHLVRRAAAQAGMRPMLVVPVNASNHVAVHDRPAHRNCFESHGFFQRPDEPLDDGDTAVLADGTKAWFDVVPLKWSSDFCSLPNGT
jgi:hypothetical protein